MLLSTSPGTPLGKTSHPGSTRRTLGDVKTVHLDAAELALLRGALRTYIRTFGHDEHEIVEQARELVHKLESAADDEVAEAPELIG